MPIRPPKRWAGHLSLMLLLTVLPGCADRQYRKGNEALDRGDTSEAIEHYLKAVKRVPDDADYHFALGQAWLREPNYKRAIAEFSRAAELEPQRTDVLQPLAFAYTKVNDIDAAIDVYWRIFAVQKQSISVFDKLRPLLESRGRYSEATEAAIMVSKALRFDPTRLSDMGTVYLRAGHEKEAARLYERALEMKPNQPILWRALGDIRFRANNGPGAAEAYAQAFKLDPNDNQSALGNAAALRKLGQIDEALRLYVMVSGRDPNMVEPRVGMTQLFLALGRVDDAATNAREAYVRRPDDPEVQAMMGAVDLAQGEYEKAVALLERAQRSDLGSKSWVTRMLGDAYAAQGERATARQYYARAISLSPEDGAAYLGMCKLDLEDAREEQGIDRCQKAMKFAPELRDDAVAVMTGYYEKLDRLAKAAEVEAKAPPAPKASRRASRAASSTARAPGDAKQQLGHLRELQKEIQGTPEETRSAREWFELGQVSLKLEDLTTAEAALTKAWQLEPTNSQYRLKMASMLLAQGRYDSALVHFKEIIREDDRAVEPRISLVQAYLGRGSAGDALEVLKELRELAPRDPRVFDLSAEAYFDLDLQPDGQRYQAQAVALRGKKTPTP